MGAAFLKRLHRLCGLRIIVLPCERISRAVRRNHLCALLRILRLLLPVFLLTRLCVRPVAVRVI